MVKWIVLGSLMLLGFISVGVGSSRGSSGGKVLGVFLLLAAVALLVVQFVFNIHIF